MDGCPERHFVAQIAVTTDKPLHNPYGTVNISKMLPLVEVANHLAKIVGSVTELGKLPVDDEELVGSYWLLRS